MTTRPLVEARKVSKTFGATAALTEVSLELGAGEMVAVTGASGSGKSTLLHCMSGIVRPDGGEVYYDGERLDTTSEDRRSTLRRSDFGVLFQFGQLIPELTGVENVALPLLLSGVRRPAALARARQWMEQFGVDQLQSSRPGEMSGGEGQRVAMARAMVTGPRIVFADEPTGSLDTLSGESVLQALVEVASRTDAAVMLVTHDPRVAAHADREVTVRDGQLLSPGVRP